MYLWKAKKFNGTDIIFDIDDLMIVEIKPRDPDEKYVWLDLLFKNKHKSSIYLSTYHFDQFIIALNVKGNST